MELNLDLIRKEIHAYANNLFNVETEISEESIRNFIGEVRRLASNSLEEAYHQHAKDGAVLATMRREDFEDFSTGYIGRMEDWYNEHKSELLSEGISIDEEKQRAELEAGVNNLTKRYYIEAAVGTAVVGAVAVAIPLLVSTSLLLLLAEAALLFTVYKRCEKATTEFREEERRRQFEETKQALIDHTERQVFNWLRDAQDESLRLDNEFKIIS